MATIPHECFYNYSLLCSKVVMTAVIKRLSQSICWPLEAVCSKCCCKVFRVLLWSLFLQHVVFTWLTLHIPDKIWSFKPFISLMVLSFLMYSLSSFYVLENTLCPRYMIMNNIVMPISTWKLPPSRVAMR